MFTDADETDHPLEPNDGSYRFSCVDTLGAAPSDAAIAAVYGNVDDGPMGRNDEFLSNSETAPIRRVNTLSREDVL